MSDTDPREAFVDAFEADDDPLARYEPTFEEVDADPFVAFRDRVLAARDVAQRTLDGHERVWRQWTDHMADEGRHPACPTADHVRAFARHERDTKENAPRTVAEKLRKLNELVQYWQADPAFPHPQDYNPVALATQTVDLSYEERKEPPHIPLEELRGIVDAIDTIRDHAIVVCQLKLGLRAGELCNLQVQDLAIDDANLQRHYPRLGTHGRLDGHQNAVHVPHDREGNKSRRPRLLPLDAETRGVLSRWLRIRPQSGVPWVFCSWTTHGRLRRKAVNQVWKAAFHPEYAESEEHRAVTSHYGRHRFTTYWTVGQDLNRELVKYMRGDTPGSADIDERGAVDEYIHSYYPDVEYRYREQMYEIGWAMDSR